MPALVDTNILLRSVQPSHPMHTIAVGAMERLLGGEEPFILGNPEYCGISECGAMQDWQSLLLVDSEQSAEVAQRLGNIEKSE